MNNVIALPTAQTAQAEKQAARRQAIALIDAYELDWNHLAVMAAKGPDRKPTGGYYVQVFVDGILDAATWASKLGGQVKRHAWDGHYWHVVHTPDVGGVSFSVSTPHFIAPPALPGVPS